MVLLRGARRWWGPSHCSTGMEELFADMCAGLCTSKQSCTQNKKFLRQTGCWTLTGGNSLQTGLDGATWGEFLLLPFLTNASELNFCLKC